MKWSVIPAQPNLLANEDRNMLPLSVLDGIDDEEIERQLEEVRDRVQITPYGILRDVSWGFTRSSLSRFLALLLLPHSEFMGCKTILGTGAIRYPNGWLLSPDVSVFTSDRKFSMEVLYHVYRFGPAPYFTAEVVWEIEADVIGKGFDKVNNLIFPAVGTNDTRTEEAWVLVIQKGAIKAAGRITPSNFHNLFLIGPVLSWVLVLLLHGCFERGGRTRPSDNGYYVWMCEAFAALRRWIVTRCFQTAVAQAQRPATAPYLAVCLRGRAPIYYPLLHDHYLVVPPESYYYNAEPIQINSIYREQGRWFKFGGR